MRGSVKLIISIIISLALAGYVFRFLDTDDFINTLNKLCWKWVALSFLCFIMYQTVRTMRLQIMVMSPSKKSFWILFNIVCLYGFLNNNLPAGLGEAALVWLLKKNHKVGLVKGSSVILVARFFDVLIYSIIFILLTIFWYTKVPRGMILYMYAIAGLLGFIFFVVWILYRLSKIKRNWENIINRKVWSLFQQFLGELINLWDGKLIKQMLCHTMVMWLLMYLFYCSIIYSLNYRLHFIDILFLYIIIFPIKLLPVKTVANVGTHEMTWFIALNLIGVNPEYSATLSFGSHAVSFVILCMSLLFPLLFFFISRQSNKQN